MNIVAVVGLVALIVLVTLTSLLVLRQKMRRVSGPLPDGDYVVTEEGTRETPQGVVTVLKVVEPEEAAGRIITVVKGESAEKEMTIGS